MSTPSTLYDLFRQQAAAHGDAVAVQGLNAADLTYNGFIAQTERIIEALTAWGIGRGDRVIIQLPNGPEAFVAMHGVGAVAVAMLADLRGSATEFEHFMRFVQPKAVILQYGVESSGRALAQQDGVRVFDIIPTPEAGAGRFTFVQPFSPLSGEPALNGPDDLAYLLSTSGTTTLPKLVPNSQRVMLGHVMVPISRQYELFGETVPLHLLNYVPLHMSFGINVSSSALASGGSIACMPGFDPQKFFAWLDVYRPTFIFGPPAVFEQLLALASQHRDVLERYQPRYVFTASAALPEPVQAGIYRAFNAPIVQGYGMTEIGRISRLVLPVGSAPTTTIGRVVDPENTRILAPDGRFLPPSEAGEIVVRSALFTGYWNNPEADEEAFHDGWFRTGDEGFIDEAGDLTLVGRVKEVINSGGAKVSPVEVEVVLKQHPQVVDAVVFGLKHAELGETVAAAVVGDVSERELRKFVAERLQFYKVPMRIFLVEAIPRTASGKIQRNRLAERLKLL